jgi:hypothetical protein
VVAFGLGLLSLAYEMYLYRVVALAFEPKPFTFATVLCLFLLAWSIGVLLAQWIPWRFALTLALTSASTLVASPLASRPWPDELNWSQMALAAGFWLPCLGFGAAFGQLVMAAAVKGKRRRARLWMEHHRQLLGHPARRPGRVRGPSGV